MNGFDDVFFVCGSFVNLQKPFDTVNHNVPLSKLCHYGIRGLSNKWFASCSRLKVIFINCIILPVL